MSGYERFALILDSERSSLGGPAMRLLELGVDVLYANDLDEAALLARQEAARLGAVLVPASFERGQIAPLVSSVCSQLATGTRSLVVVGLEPDPAFQSELAAAGAKWCLWEPYEERELRFVMTAAMATDFGGDRRKDLRIPTQIDTPVFMGRHRKEVTVHDLSMGGAYFATPHPFLEGSRLSVEIPLPEGSLVGKAAVVNAKTADRPGRPDVPEGMGVVFTDLAPEMKDRLAHFISGWIRRFEL